MKNTFLSLGIVLDGRFDPAAVEAYAAHLKSAYSDHELIIVNPCAREDFDRAMNELLRKIEKIRYLKLTGFTGREVAQSAVMENAIGDIIVIGTFENLTEAVIDEAADKCFAGIDIVFGCSNLKCPWWYRAGSWFFRKLTRRLVDYEVPGNDTGLRMISRRAANAVMSQKRFHYNLSLRMTQCGFDFACLDYELPQRPVKHISFAGVWEKAAALLVLGSTKPLRFANIVGLCASLMSLLIALYSLVIRFFKHNVIEGWTTLVFFISIQFFVLFIILTFWGEYLLRILLDRVEQAPYSVIYEKHSSVMLDLDKLNVKAESVAGSINLSQTGRDR